MATRKVHVPAQDVPALAESVLVVETGYVLTYLEIALCNHGSSSREVKIYLVPDGQSAADSNLAVEESGNTSLTAGETRFYKLHPNLQPGDSVQWLCDAVASVSGVMGGLEETP